MKQNLLKYGLVMVLAIIASTGLLWADCYVEVFHDTIVKVDTVHQIDTLHHTDTVVVTNTCYMSTPQQTNYTTRSFWYDFMLPLLVGIFGAFITLVLTYLFLRPNFEIYPIAAQALNNRVWFVVKNKSPCAKLYNIKAELAYSRYNEKRNDTELIPIDLDEDNSISILSARNDNDDSFYVFHTKEAFVRDERYNQVRLRVSATNTISNIFDAKDRIFNYTAIRNLNSKVDDIRWGTLNKDIFVPVELMYNEEQLNLAKQIIKFNEKVMRVFVPQRNKETFIKEKIIWDVAEERLESIRPGNDLYVKFRRLSEIVPSINKINDDFVKLKEIYTKNTTFKHETIDKRDKLVAEMKRDLVLISGYMQRSLTN